MSKVVEKIRKRRREELYSLGASYETLNKVKEMQQIRPARSQMEVAFQKLEAHMLFVCPECGETYNSQQQWRQHLNFHHDYLCKKPEDFGFTEVNDRFHECQSCKVLVADGKRAIALLQYHRFLHLPFSRTYRCSHCPASFTRKRVLCEHLCRSHEELINNKMKEPSSTKNPNCIENTKETVQTNNTEMTKTVNQLKSTAKDNPEFYMRYICPQCGDHMENYKRWIEHIKTAHVDVVRSDCEMQRVSGTKNYYCKICCKVIHSSDSTQLQRHYFTHLQYKVNFQCAYCKVRRAYKTELLHHFIRTHIREFEKQRVYVKKPQEWGAEINEKLDKELDFLLQCDNIFGGTNGPKSMHLTSTTVPNSYSQGKRQPVQSHKIQPVQSTEKVLSNSDSDSVSQSFFDEYLKGSGLSKKHLAKRKLNELLNSTKKCPPKKTFKNNKKPEKSGLDALCAEIFDEIDMDIEKNSQSVTSSNGCTNDIKEKFLSTKINPIDEKASSQLDESETDRSIEEFIPKKRKKLNDTVETNERSSDITTKIYPTIKSLFNAKILHLCPNCGKSFGEQSTWRNHVLTAHKDLDNEIQKSYTKIGGQESLRCLTCMGVLTTVSKSELQRHSFTHMPYHAYLKCALCGTAKSNKSKMLVHLEVEHSSLITRTPSIQTTKDSPVEQSSKELENKPKIEKDFLIFQSNKSEYSHLMRHLLNARQRLNRIAAGKEKF